MKDLDIKKKKMFTVVRLLLITIFPVLNSKSVWCSLSQSGYFYKQPLTPFPAVTVPTRLSDLSTNHGSNYGLKFNHVNFGLPVVDNFLPEEDVYIADGRLLKQYAVMEHIPGDQLPDNFLNNSPLLLESFLSKFGRISPSLIPITSSGRERPPIFQPVTRNHGPVALGSGSLGYIRLSNGGVYLGSGSLGYISGQDRLRDITEARMRKGPPAGPFSFGSGSINK